jgi:CspA family cold shock protein
MVRDNDRNHDRRDNSSGGDYRSRPSNQGRNYDEFKKKFEGGGSRPQRPQDEPIGDPEIVTVKWFNTQKGFGFLTRANGEKDLFIHISVVQRSGLAGLEEGQKIKVQRGKSSRDGKESAISILETIVDGQATPVRAA